MGFELNSFRRPAEAAEYKPKHIATGDGVQLMLNLDWLTLAKMEETEADMLRSIEFENKQLMTVGNEAAEKENKSDDLNLLYKAQIHSIYGFQKAQHCYKARVLGGKPGSTDPTDRVIQSWDVISGGVAVPVCYESFVQMPEAILTSLYDFCTNYSVTVKKTNAAPSNSI